MKTSNKRTEPDVQFIVAHNLLHLTFIVMLRFTNNKGTLSETIRFRGESKRVAKCAA